MQIKRVFMGGPLDGIKRDMEDAPILPEEVEWV